MPRITLTRNLSGLTPESFPSELERILRELEDQLAQYPDVFTKLTEDTPLPEGIRPGTVIYDVSSGSVVTKIWNGKDLIS